MPWAPEGGCRCDEDGSLNSSSPTYYRVARLAAGARRRGSPSVMSERITPRCRRDVSIRARSSPSSSRSCSRRCAPGLLRFLCARPDESFDVESLMQTFGRMRLDVENCMRELVAFGLAAKVAAPGAPSLRGAAGGQRRGARSARRVPRAPRHGQPRGPLAGRSSASAR